MSEKFSNGVKYWKNNMKMFSSLFIVLFSTFGMNAQDYSQNLDLLELYVDGEYPKCLKKSLRFIKKKKNQEAVYPHLLVAQTYFEISRDIILEEEYPNAQAHSVAYARSYYEKRSMIPEGAEKFYFELREFVLEDAMYAMEDIDSADFEKINACLQDLTVFSPNATEVPFIRASALLNLGDFEQADVMLQHGEEMLMNTSDQVELSRDEHFRLEYSIKHCAEFLEDLQLSDKADHVLSLWEAFIR